MTAAQSDAGDFGVSIAAEDGTACRVDPSSADFTERYGDLLVGSYDCVDRVVLNAFFPIGHNPGGFRSWWRRLHGSDDQLDDTHLLRMAGRFARRVKAWAAANGVPVIFCKAGSVST